MSAKRAASFSAQSPATAASFARTRTDHALLCRNPVYRRNCEPGAESEDLSGLRVDLHGYNNSCAGSRRLIVRAMVERRSPGWVPRREVLKRLDQRLSIPLGYNHIDGRHHLSNFFAVDRKQNDLNVTQSLFDRDRFHSVQVWHHEVHQDDIRAMAMGLSNGLDAIELRHKFKLLAGCQDVPHRRTNVRFVSTM